MGGGEAASLVHSGQSKCFVVAGRVHVKERKLYNYMCMHVEVDLSLVKITELLCVVANNFLYVAKSQLRADCDVALYCLF